MKATIFGGLNCVTLDSPIGDKHNSPNVINNHPITKVKNGICSPDYHIKVEYDSVVIRKENEEIDRFYFEDIISNPNNFKDKIKQYKLSKFFDNDLLEGIIDYINDINTHKKNIDIHD